MKFKALDLEGNKVGGNGYTGTPLEKFIIKRLDTVCFDEEFDRDCYSDILYTETVQIQPDTLKVSFNDKDFYSVEEVKEFFDDFDIDDVYEMEEWQRSYR